MRSKIWDGVDPALRRSYVPERGGGGKDESIFSVPVLAMLLSARSGAAVLSMLVVVLSLAVLLWSSGVGSGLVLDPSGLLSEVAGSGPGQLAVLAAVPTVAVLFGLLRRRRLGASLEQIVEQTVPLLDQRSAFKEATRAKESHHLQQQKPGSHAPALDGKQGPPVRQRNHSRDQPRRASREKRIQFHEMAQKRASAWITLLVRGIDLTVGDKLCEVKLRRPKCQELLIDGEPFPIVGMGLRLRGSTLSLVFADESGGGSDRIFEVKHDAEQDALEMTLALKVVRGGVDTGAGISAWGDRPDDSLKRPPPAE